MLVFFAMLAGSELSAQAGSVRTSDPAFDLEITRLLKFSIPVIGVEELRKRQGEFLVFDTREPVEFAMSHIPGASHLGFEKFDPASLDGLPKETAIVLYCSVGYRSEKAGEKLRKMGFTNVSNLYGSIFEWANRGYPLEDGRGQPTRKLHTFDENWSRWVKNPAIEKRW